MIFYGEQIRQFNEPGILSQSEPEGYQNYYVKQVSGVRSMGVPFTI